MKQKLTNLTIALVSIIATLLISELVFRFILFKSGDRFSSLKVPSYYSDHVRTDNQDYYNDNYWKLNYLFNRPMDFDYPHATLGWSGFFYRSYEHLDEKSIKQRKPVLLYGDSFAMCADSVLCFEDILNNDSVFSANHYLLNYGVGGYGVDQISILFKGSVDRFNKPFVIFSLLTSDLDRSMLKVRDGQKPYYTLSNGNLELNGTSISLSSSEFFKQNPPEINSYLWNRFKSSQFSFLNDDKNRLNDYIQQSKALNKAILLDVFKKLKETNTDFVFLIFHPETGSELDWRLTFLRDLFQEYKIPYMCDLDIREADNTFSEYNPFNYALENDGHPTTYLNQLIAKDLKRYILNPKYRKNYSSENYNDFQKSRVIKDVKYYKRLISKSPEWMNAIKQKAIDRNIPLDSMIYLDALYKADEVKDVWYYQRKIRKDTAWLKLIESKAMERGVSLDSMIYLDAMYLLEQAK